MHGLSPQLAVSSRNHWRIRGRVIIRYFRAEWLQCAALFVTGLLVRAGSLNGQRIWDDQYLALQNPFIKSPLLILESFRHYLFLESYSTHYRPIQTVSYLFDYFFWNTNAYGFHFSNLVLHATNGLLLYLLVRKLLASLWFRNVPVGVRDRAQKCFPGISLAAFLIALLWSVHPVHSAAVDYISGRADSLAFLFAATGWLLVFRGQTRKGTAARWCCFGLATVSGLAALLSREIACIWFAIFLGHLIFVEMTVGRRAKVIVVAVCFLMIGIYAGLRQLPATGSRPPASDGPPAAVRVALMARSLGDYTRLLVYPSNLYMERTILDPASFKGNAGWRSAVGIEYLSLLGLATFVTLALGCFRCGRGQSFRIFGAAWFFAGYLPISNLIPLNATVAEHWLYLPSVGFLIFLAGCVVELPLRFRQASMAFACLALLGLSARSMVRSTDWADEETFYTRTIQSGGSSVRAAVNLAEIYSQRGDTAAAERLFRMVLDLAPDYPTARNNLANVLDKQGRKAEARDLFDSSAKAAIETRKDYPGTWVAAINLARLKRAQGDFDGAIELLDQARLDYPGVWEVIRCQAEVLRVAQQAEAAGQLVESFAMKNWWHHEASVALGRLYAAQGDAERAAAAWRHASRLDVHDAESLNLIAGMRLRQDRLHEAFQIQQRAVARQPDEPRQYRMLSEILTRMGRTDEARAALAQVSQMEAFAKTESRIN